MASIVLRGKIHAAFNEPFNTVSTKNDKRAGFHKRVISALSGT